MSVCHQVLTSHCATLDTTVAIYAFYVISFRLAYNCPRRCRHRRAPLIVLICTDSRLYSPSQVHPSRLWRLFHEQSIIHQFQEGHGDHKSSATINGKNLKSYHERPSTDTWIISREKTEPPEYPDNQNNGSESSKDFTQVCVPDRLHVDRTSTQGNPKTNPRSRLEPQSNNRPSSDRGGMTSSDPSHRRSRRVMLQGCQGFFEKESAAARHNRE